MNLLRERLKKQASDFAWLPENDGRKAAAFEDKLVELIVKECALLCSDPVVVLQHWGIDSKSE